VDQDQVPQLVERRPLAIARPRPRVTRFVARILERRTIDFSSSLARRSVTTEPAATQRRPDEPKEDVMAMEWTTLTAPVLLGLLILAVGCGALTTLVGQGGGLLLLLGPLAALQLSAPALLVGNAHRLWAMRRVLERDLALRLGVGALLGSMVGGIAAVRVPKGALLTAMLLMAALGLGKRYGLQMPTPPRRVLPLWTFATGAICAVGGGAGLLVAPLLMALGLTGAPFVATAAAVAVSMHIGRLLGYGAGGGLESGLLAATLPLAVALMLGNRLGLGLRGRVGGAALRQLEHGALVVVAAVAVLRWWVGG
jgi:uncharacterized membrane protein YfcA